MPNKHSPAIGLKRVQSFYQIWFDENGHPSTRWQHTFAQHLHSGDTALQRSHLNAIHYNQSVIMNNKELTSTFKEFALVEFLVNLVPNMIPIQMLTNKYKFSELLQLVDPTYMASIHGFRIRRLHHWAAFSKNIESFTWILQQVGLQPKLLDQFFCLDEQDNSILHIICRENFCDALKLILNTPNIIDNGRLIKELFKKNKDGYTPIDLCLISENPNQVIDIVQSLQGRKIKTSSLKAMLQYPFRTYEKKGEETCRHHLLFHALRIENDKLTFFLLKTAETVFNEKESFAWLMQKGDYKTGLDVYHDATCFSMSLIQTKDDIVNILFDWAKNHCNKEQFNRFFNTTVTLSSSSTTNKPIRLKEAHLLHTYKTFEESQAVTKILNQYRNDKQPDHEKQVEPSKIKTKLHRKTKYMRINY